MSAFTNKMSFFKLVLYCIYFRAVINIVKMFLLELTFKLIG